MDTLDGKGNFHNMGIMGIYIPESNLHPQNPKSLNSYS